MFAALCVAEPYWQAFAAMDNKAIDNEPMDNGRRLGDGGSWAASLKVSPALALLVSPLGQPSWSALLASWTSKTNSIRHLKRSSPRKSAGRSFLIHPIAGGSIRKPSLRLRG